MDIQALIQQLQQMHQKQAQQSFMPPTQANMPNASAVMPQQDNSGTQQKGPLDGMLSGALSKLYTNGAAQATGLPWLAGGSTGNATSALLSLLMG